MRGQSNVLFNRRGGLRGIWIAGGCLLALAAVMAAVVFLMITPLSRAACNQKGDEYGLQSHYRLLSDACYITLPNGRSIDSNNLQGVDVGEFFGKDNR